MDKENEKTITLILKSCGHKGYVKENYVQDQIMCSQCELLGKEAKVKVTKSKTVPFEIPETSFRNIESWIKKQLQD